MPNNITQDYKVFPVRTAAILTNSYVSSPVLAEMQRFNEEILEVNLTLGSLTSAEVKIEFSQDNVTFAQETFSSVSLGTDTIRLGEHSMLADGIYQIALPNLSRYLRISAKGTGTVTGSSMAIKLIAGVVA